MTKVKERIKVYHKKVKELFGEKAKKTAQKVGYGERERKISASLLLEAMVCAVYIYGQITLSNIAGVARKINKECDATLQAFDEKFTKKAVLFFQAMFAIALKENIPQTNVILPLIGAFAAVYILDSSTVSLPES